jgi:phage terminase large subunit GpA-like protein
MAARLSPPPRLTVDEWANRFRYLSRESSSRPGKYRTDFAPYQREPMQSVTMDGVSQVVMMFGSQLGKTEIQNNVVGFFIHLDPSPILMVQPRVEDAEGWSKERLAPMIRDTPVLTGLVRDPRSRDSGNTITTKSFPGGSIAAVGANAPAGLARRPCRVVLLDEVDRMPLSAGTEGDPCALAIRRTESFWNAVVVMTSTPTVKGLSRIESAFGETDQRRWFCPCPRCGAEQHLKWSQVQWPKDEPEKAWYTCEACKAELDDAERLQMVRAGAWKPTAEFRGKIGYHLNGIASPFPCKRGYVSRLHQMVAEFLAAKRAGAMQLRTWVNTFLAETWEEQGDAFEPGPLASRREDYGAEIPAGVVLLTAGVDVQPDRIEAEVVGWGLGEESWGVEYLRIVGSPGVLATWAQLDAALTRGRKRADGVILRVAAALVDSGNSTKYVYDFTRTRAVKNVFACKGIGGTGKPLVGRFSRSNSGRVTLFPVGVDTAKELIYSRIALVDRGPGYMHFPTSYDSEWFEQLTAERRVVRYEKGVRKVVWEKVRDRNEALDCRVYATGALACRSFDLSKLSRSVAKPGTDGSDGPGPSELSPETSGPEVEAPRQASKLRPRSAFRAKGGSSFVRGWNRW